MDNLKLFLENTLSEKDILHLNDNILKVHEHHKYKKIINELILLWNGLFNKQILNINLREDIYKHTYIFFEKTNYNKILKLLKKNVTNLKIINLHIIINNKILILQKILLSNLIEKINKDNILKLINKLIFLISIFLFNTKLKNKN